MGSIENKQMEIFLRVGLVWKQIYSQNNANLYIQIYSQLLDQ